MPLSSGAVVELLSIHFPKTGGSTVQEMLVRHFGDQLLLVYGYTFHSPSGNKFIPASLHISDRIRALHGHFPAQLFKEQYPTAQTAIWLRDPVDRAISYYEYWLRTPPHGNPAHDRFLAERPSVLEFSKHLATEAVQYFEGLSLSDFDFIGIMDNFSQDAVRFATWLEKTYVGAGGVLQRLVAIFPDVERDAEYGVPKINRTDQKASVPYTLRLQIAEILQYEMEIYRAALSARA